MLYQFNVIHFIFLAFTLIIAILFGLSLKGKDKKIQKTVFATIICVNLAMHFIKFFIPPFNNINQLKSEILFPSLCSAHILLFVPFFFSKSDILMDYMFYAGFLCGGGGMLFPVAADGASLSDFYLWYYWFYHAVAFIVPVAMVISGYHKLNYRRIWKFPFVFIAVMLFVMLNNVIEVESGLVTVCTEGLWPTRYRNFSLVWAPTYGPLAEFLDKITLPFMKTVPFGAHKGEACYWPLLYLLPTIFLFSEPIAIILSSPFEYMHIATDLKSLKKKLKQSEIIKNTQIITKKIK